MALCGGLGDARAMHPDASIAEALPRVYRRVLDAVERLERLDGRRDATRLRLSAIKVYSGAWNSKSHRQLEDVLARVETATRDQERRVASGS
jgi:hypothetical protein